MVCEAGHTSGKDLGYLQPKTHLYTCDMGTPSFWWGSDAPEYLSGETLDLLEKTLIFRLVPVRASKGGSSVDCFAWLG